MKLKSLILGSVAAAGLSTASFAADPAFGVLTSLDVCDALGLSGLTISSDTNCLQISGSVDYRLRYGNFRNNANVGNTYDPSVDPFVGDEIAGTNFDLDWDTRARAFLRVVATADSDFGPAAAVIGLRSVDEWRYRNEGYSVGQGTPTQLATPSGFAGGDHTNGVIIDEAYVSIGDSTVIMAGLKRRQAAGSIANIGDDSPYSFLFMSDKIDGGGVLIDADDNRLGGASIQIVSDLGNGVSAGIGLENIGNIAGAPSVGGASVGAWSSLETQRAAAQLAGTLVGVLQYAGDGVTAHITGLGYGVMDGNIDSFAIHAGATGSFDIFRVRGAIGYDSDFKNSASAVQGIVTGLGSVEATFDMFRIALSGEFAHFNNTARGGSGVNETDFGIGGRISADVTEGVAINFDAAWFRDGFNGLAGGSTDTLRLQAEIAADVTETIRLSAAVGGYFGSGVYAPGTGPGAAQAPIDNLYYGRAGLAWNPGGGFASSANLEVNSEGGWRTEFNASKSFN